MDAATTLQLVAGVAASLVEGALAHPIGAGLSGRPVALVQSVRPVGVAQSVRPTGLAQSAPSIDPSDALLDRPVVRLALATALGLFVGLERERAEKAAGVRTFALISLLGAVFVVLDAPWLLAVGALLVVVQAALLAIEGLQDEGDGGLSLTTSASMLAAYGVGALVGMPEGEYVLEGVAVAVLVSLLLVQKRQLHSLAGGLDRSELTAASEFAILAFVIYPLLPPGTAEVDVAGATVAVEPRVAWLMVVTVAAIGIVNYAIVATYGGRGVAVTGFFGGLAASTAVVGTMIDYVRQRPDMTDYATAAVVLGLAAMALRNLGIALAFTAGRGLLVDVALPLGAIVVAALVLAALTADWSESVPFEVESPFSLRTVVGFGAVFTVVLVAGSLAESTLGTAGFYAAAFATGLVSSGGATTSAVILYRSGGVDAEAATVAILLATAASLSVQAVLTAAGGNREFARKVAVRCAALLVVAAAATALLLL